MRWAAVSLLIVTLILVPFFLFEGVFNRMAERIMAGEASTWTAALAIGGLLASDVVLPIPSSLVSAAAGVLLGFWRGTGVVWAGMTVSCVVGYYIGARSADRARRFVGEDGLRRAAELSSRYGSLAIVLCRPVPVLAEASVIFAGLVHLPAPRFFVVCILSNFGVALGYAAVGAFSMHMESFLLAFAGSLALPGLALLGARLWWGRRQPRA